MCDSTRQEFFLAKKGKSELYVSRGRALRAPAAPLWYSAEIIILHWPRVRTSTVWETLSESDWPCKCCILCTVRVLLKGYRNLKPMNRSWVIHRDWERTLVTAPGFIYKQWSTNPRTAYWTIKYNFIMQRRKILVALSPAGELKRKVYRFIAPIKLCWTSGDLKAPEAVMKPSTCENETCFIDPLAGKSVRKILPCPNQSQLYNIYRSKRSVSQPLGNNPQVILKHKTDSRRITLHTFYEYFHTSAQ